MRILHVEDNSTDADLVARQLHRSSPDIQIDVAHTLHDARAHLRRPHNYRAALIDLRLPDGNGLSLLGEIRERDLSLAVVMLTGSGDQESAIAALQSGADDYIAKDDAAFTHLGNTLEAAVERFDARHKRHSRTLRVLYAEHNQADIDLTRRHLAKHAPYIRLTVVPDATRVLELLPLESQQKLNFDVVLMDYRLPGNDALDAVNILRIQRQLEIPIVIVSGQGSEAIAARAIHLGVDDYIAKHSGYLYELIPTLEMVVRQFELRREQQSLQKTTQHLNYLLEASPVVLYTLRLEDGVPRATWVSNNIQRLFGFSPEDALQPGWWNNQLHDDDQSAAVSISERLGQSDHAEHDYRFLDRDGHTHWIRDELRIISRGADSSIDILGAWHDITEQKQTELLQHARVNALNGLATGQALDEVLGAIAQQVEAVYSEMRVSILLRNLQQDTLYTVAAPSLPQAYCRAVDGLKPGLAQGSCGAAVALAEPVIVADIQTHPYWKNYREIAEQAGLRACWSVPFMDEANTVLGTFAIYYGQVSSPDEKDLYLINEFAQIIGLAVQRSNADAYLRQAAAVFSSTREGIVITDLTPRIVAINQAYTEITGYEEQEVLGQDPNILRSGFADETLYHSMWTSLKERGYWRGEIWNRRKNGEVYPQLLTISTVFDHLDRAKNYVGVMTDISQLKKSEENLERLAHYDPLTELPNRLLIHSRLVHALSHAHRENSQVAVLFIDLDRFKNVNDSLGHPVGDDLLRLLAQRLKSRLRGEDTFGRLGGDEFLLILDHDQNPNQAGKIAKELLGLLEAPFELPNQHEIFISASAGISIYPQDGNDASQLIQHADAAMYKAKAQGRNTYCFYTPELTKMVNQRLAMESRMRRAIARGEFVLHYQPQVEIDSGDLRGCEVLVRWDDPEQGFISPADFIPIAEETGLITALGSWILHTAFAQFRGWLDAGYADFCLAINVSARQLLQPQFADELAVAISHYDLPVDRLKLELTESTIMERGDGAITLLDSIKALGVNLSIDDFGTGYSSLAYLKKFPIDELKIDRSFVRDIPDDENDAEIAATIIAMAHNLKLNVVAEGVESREQADFLLSHGCQACQGFFYHRPLPAADFEALLQKRKG